MHIYFVFAKCLALCMALSSSLSVVTCSETQLSKECYYSASRVGTEAASLSDFPSVLWHPVGPDQIKS